MELDYMERIGTSTVEYAVIGTDLDAAYVWLEEQYGIDVTRVEAVSPYSYGWQFVVEDN